MSAFYLIGIGMAVLAGLVLKRFVFHGDASPFLMELPKYRLPTVRNVARQLWDKGSDFLKRAFTVIFSGDTGGVVSAKLYAEFEARAGCTIQRSGLHRGVGGADLRSGGLWQCGGLHGGVDRHSRQRKRREHPGRVKRRGRAEHRDARRHSRRVSPPRFRQYRFCCLCFCTCPVWRPLRPCAVKWKAAVSPSSRCFRKTGVAWVVATVVYQAGHLLGLG